MHILRSVALAVALTATAASAATLTFVPARPAAGDLVTVTARGSWPDSCVPTSLAVSVSGQRLLIEARVGPSNGFCSSSVTEYTLSTTFQTPTQPGLYNVEYTTEDATGRRVLDATATLPVTTGACAFGQSLTQDVNSVFAGEPFRLQWCDPSSGANTVKYYRVYAAQSPSGPFSIVTDLPAGTTTYMPTNVPVGTTYYYIQASRCPGGGECSQASDAVVQSNIVRIDVAPTNGCLPTPTNLCLANGRFAVSARWKTTNGQNGSGHAVQLTRDGGYYWFFEPTNTEVTVKVLDACQSAAPRFWFFAAGMTNVEVELIVRDTKTNLRKTYTNAQGNPFTTILDTNAFATCP